MKRYFSIHAPRPNFCLAYRPIPNASEAYDSVMRRLFFLWDYTSDRIATQAYLSQFRRNHETV